MASEEETKAPGRPEPEPANSVLEMIELKSGELTRVSLPQADSQIEATPIVGSTRDVPRSLRRTRGSYQLLGELARGGMGVILRGHNYDLGRDVAIKVLDEKLADQPHVLQRFVEEAQIGGQLQHPGVVPVYELGLMADERPFFAMKLVKGRTLSELFAKRDSPAQDRARFLSIFEDVCQTVAYAHSKGVVHRDLKPANVMVGAFGEVQVVDWGLAKVLQRGGVADERRAQEKPRSAIETVRSGPHSGSDSIVGSVLGTPAYMPPEQARGEVDSLDERADVFALGAILCELLTGRPPYAMAQGENLVHEAADGKLGGARGRLRAAEADAELVDLALECLCPSPAGRPRSAEALVTIIHRYLTASEERAHVAQLEATEARVRAEQERKSRRLTAALGLALVLLVLSVGGGYLWLEARDRERLEDLRHQVDLAHQEALELQGEGRLEEAWTAAQGAVRLAESSGVPDELVLHARQFAQVAQSRVLAAEVARDLEHKDRELFERLEVVGELREQGDLEIAELDAKFRGAFEAYGLDLESDDLRPALEALRRRGMGEELALVLDDWARLKRELEGWESPDAVGLTAIAADLDPDPLRIDMREALMERDRERLRELATPENARRLPPTTAWVLCAALEDMGSPREAMVVLDEALQRHPDSYRLQKAYGYSKMKDHPAAKRQALDHFRVARALRPRDRGLTLLIAQLAFDLGDFAEVVRIMTTLAEAEQAAGRFGSLGTAELVLGRNDRAIEAFEQAQAMDPLTSWQEVEFLTARYVEGLHSQEEFLAAAAGLRQSAYGDRLIAWALVLHPDPPRRNAERAQALYDSWQADPSLSWFDPVVHLALLQEQGRPEELVHELDQLVLLNLRPDVALAVASMGATAHADLGNGAAARHWLGLARGVYEEHVGIDAEVWRRSFHSRLYQEALRRVR